MALELLETERKKTPFTLGIRDITNDPVLLERHGTEVPVVFIDGRNGFFGKVDP